MFKVCWFSRSHGLKSREKTNSIFLMLNGSRWCEEVLKEVLAALDESLADILFIISKENNQQRSRAVCWSFPRWWQDGLRDVSFYPLLQLLWQRRMARRRNCHEDESAQGDFVSLYLCKPRPDDSLAKSWQFLLKNKMYGRQNLENSGFISGSGHCSG